VAGVLVVLLVLFGAAAWYFSGRIHSGALESTPSSFPPAYEAVRVVAVNSDELTLEAGPSADVNWDAPAVFGLAWDGGTGMVSPAFRNADGTVTRELVDLTSGTTPKVGQLAALERAYWLGDPAVSFDPRTIGYPHTEVTFGNGYPAWYFGPPSGTEGTSRMAIFVHGQNGSRSDGLRVTEAISTIVPVLDITYRNDVGAPSDGTGLLHYGATEWQDLDAAVTWARSHGATDLILVGQSMGGGIVASFMENSAQTDVVSKIVLDAPMLSLPDAVEYGSRTAMPGGNAVPAPLLWAAERVAALRYGVDWSAVDYLDDTSWVTTPTLVIHGTADPRVPVRQSVALKAAEPELVTLKAFPGALHTEAWNFDRQRYAELLQDWVRTSP
jgi:uncharacterized protein